LAARVLEIPEVAAAARIAGYAAMPEEPGTQPLLDDLLARGCDVLLPLLRADLDLEWASYRPGSMRVGRFGISEPTGARRDVGGVHGASVVICPALAADEQGHRLGRGGGSYDRVLSRLAPSVLRVALLYDDEVLEDVPVDDHDEPVHVIVTPHRTLRAGTP
jgi:5-formyltetrahydrofolate cyclo-ligase